jgi:hypothetical protein
MFQPAKVSPKSLKGLYKIHKKIEKPDMFENPA